MTGRRVQSNDGSSSLIGIPSTNSGPDDVVMAACRGADIGVVDEALREAGVSMVGIASSVGFRDGRFGRAGGAAAPK